MFKENQELTNMDQTELLMNKGQLKHISDKNVNGNKLEKKKVK